MSKNLLVGRWVAKDPQTLPWSLDPKENARLVSIRKDDGTLPNFESSNLLVKGGKTRIPRAKK